MFIKNLLVPLLIVCLSSGCAVSTQKFVDLSYDEHGNVTREVRAQNRTWSPPFRGANSASDHLLMMNEDLEGWEIQMGSESDLTGGDMAELASQLAPYLNLIAGVPAP